MPMHADEIDVSGEVVAALVRGQFPAWAHLPVRRVESHGTVNALFRIGGELVARLPLQGEDPEVARAGIVEEMEAARRLRAVSPVATPEPVALGEPGAGYRLPWAVYRWLSGAVAGHGDLGDRPGVAVGLARFVAALRELPTGGRRFSGTRRGGLLDEHDEYVVGGLRRSAGMVDTDALALLWRRLRATPRTQPDTWTHGDLMPGNLLVDDDRLVGVIDVGQLGVADPALDLQPAWNLFGPRARTAFRAGLGCDDAEWDRGKGWALAQAIGCLWYYRETNPVMSRTARRTLQALLDDEAAPA